VPSAEPEYPADGATDSPRLDHGLGSLSRARQGHAGRGRAAPAVGSRRAHRVERRPVRADHAAAVSQGATRHDSLQTAGKSPGRTVKNMRRSSRKPQSKEPISWSSVKQFLGGREAEGARNGRSHSGRRPATSGTRQETPSARRVEPARAGRAPGLQCGRSSRCGRPTDRQVRKVCLPPAEVEAGTAPGSSYPVFDTKFGKVGLMICYDGFFPEVARELSSRGRRSSPGRSGAAIPCWPRPARARTTSISSAAPSWNRRTAG